MPKAQMQRLKFTACNLVALVRRNDAESEREKERFAKAYRISAEPLASLESTVLNGPLPRSL